MRTFEERYTAWVDGALADAEREAFEREYPTLVAERAEVDKLQHLLRSHLQAPPLSNPDFFNSQLMQVVEREAASKAVPVAVRRRVWFGFPRLVWAGLGSAVAAVALVFALVPRPHDKGADYVAEVLKAQTNAPGVKATVDAKKDVTIIKLDGLEKLPPDKELKR